PSHLGARTCLLHTVRAGSRESRSKQRLCEEMPVDSRNPANSIVRVLRVKKANKAGCPHCCSGHRVTRKAGTLFTLEASPNPESLFTHLLGPGIQGLAFANVGNSGLAGDLEKLFQEGGALLALDATGCELHILNWQPIDRHAETERFVLGALLGPVQNPRSFAEERVVEVSSFRGVEDVGVGFAITDLPLEQIDIGAQVCGGRAVICI